MLEFFNDNWLIIAAVIGWLVALLENRRRDHAEKEAIRLEHSLGSRSSAFEARLRIYIDYEKDLNHLTTEYYTDERRHSRAIASRNPSVSKQDYYDSLLKELLDEKTLWLNVRRRLSLVELVGSDETDRIANTFADALDDVISASGKLQTAIATEDEAIESSRGEYSEALRRKGQTSIALAVSMRTDLGIEELLNPETKRSFVGRAWRSITRNPKKATLNHLRSPKEGRPLGGNPDAPESGAPLISE